MNSPSTPAPVPAPIPALPPKLQCAFVRLEPLRPEHAPALAAAVCDGELWKLPYTWAPAPDRMEAEIARRLALQAAGSMLPFAVLDSAGIAVGMTTFMQIERAHRHVEIGSTWYAARVQRSALNTEAKLLLLGEAFDAWGCIAVELRTHVLNRASRRAIERLGAKLDGVLRNHMVAVDGTLRDTAAYSIVREEWPAVRNHLRYQLSLPRG